MFDVCSSIRKKVILFTIGLTLVSNSGLAQDLNPATENETPNEVSKSKEQVPIVKDPEPANRPVHTARKALIESLQAIQIKSRKNDDQYGASWHLRTEIYAIENGYPLTSGEQLLEEFAKKGKRQRLLLGGLALVPSATYYASAASLSTAHPAHLQVAGALSIGSAVLMLKPSQAEQIQHQYQTKRHVFNRTQSTHSTSNEIERPPPQDVPQSTERPYWRLVISNPSSKHHRRPALSQVQWKTFREQLNRWEEYLDKYPKTAFRRRIEAHIQTQ